MLSETNNPIIYPRRVQSFVRRDSRATPGQRRAFETLWPHYGLDPKVEYVPTQNIKTVLEIGFGSGFSLLAAAKQCPEYEFIGIEMHKPSIGTLLANLEQQQVNNVRIYYADAVEVLMRCISDESLDGVQIFFPDPWPKRRHNKRRLIQSAFVKAIASKLKAGAIFHLATDWQDYAEHMMKVLSDESNLLNTAGEKQFSNRSMQRPVITKFEHRGQLAGRAIWELQFFKIP